MIILDKPIDYELYLSDGWYRISRESIECKFSIPATTQGVAKLYTISCDDSLLYVGITRQPMANRLRNGFLANGSDGYHGYKWKFLETNLKLSIWTAMQFGVKVPLHQMEIIEAEVAYTCRQLSGQWPTHQHEIHFSPSEQWHREAAVKIFKHAIGKSID